MFNAAGPWQDYTFCNLFDIPVDNFGTVVGENPTPYGILALWAVNGLSIVCWDCKHVRGSKNLTFHSGDICHLYILVVGSSHNASVSIALFHLVFTPITTCNTKIRNKT